MPTTKIVLPDKIDLEKFISVHAHDLRTPYNHINGFSKMILNHLGEGPLTDFQKEDLGTVYKSGMRALTLMNGLIDIARYNRGETKFDPAEFDLRRTLEECQAQWAKFNPGSEAQIEILIKKDTPANLHADEHLFRQLVFNQISFVNLYCDAKTRILVEVEMESGNSLFCFTSQGTKARAPSELEREMLGFLDRVFVELHGGQIRLAEENDNGATVQFSLPK